jgi:cell division protein FtsI (penicillin-binding protein 3)/stage V sporulation protein D (sporulation-specific penicillin-binding protein)
MLLGVLLIFGGIIARLFYWQIIQGYSLKKVVENQAVRETTSVGSRGNIFTADKQLLVGNTAFYHLMADKTLLKTAPDQLAEELAPLLVERDLQDLTASQSAQLEQTKTTLLTDNTKYLEERLGLESTWVRLSSRIDRTLRAKIEALEIPGFYFEEYQARFYPEASMAAHLTGFVGKNDAGEDTGYFGIEGALNKELVPQTRKNRFLIDALGNLLGGENSVTTQSLNGRDVNLTIRRDIQYLIEQELKNGLERYGAARGEVIVMEVATGNILGLAGWPNYDQEKYYQFEQSLYKNPTITDLYEPGSTFKILTVSAGIDTGAVTPDTTCPVCAGPRQIGKYTVRTWNDEYVPDINVRDALAQSNNVAMIYVAESMGADTFKNYLKKFGIGEAINLDLQEDTATPFPEKWGPIELATSAFGQGISTTSMQMVRAVNAVANNGVMMRPKIIDKVIDQQTGKEIVIPPKEERRVISSETATTVRELMVNSAKHGEAQWIFKNTHTIAGKTGTSQIPIAGGYKPDATIASFIGFAPADKPRFIMLVKLVEPQRSPWAAETAAPLWYKIAEKLFLLLNVPPDSSSISPE